MGSNKRMVSDFPPEQQAQISEEEMADPATRTYREADRLTVGFYPSGVDSLAAAVVDLSGMRRSRLSFGLRGLADPKNGTTFYKYLTRPFRIGSGAGPGQFIPLVFFGSMWYDRKWELFRFCGEREIAPDLSGEIVSRVPHFYVIGVEFTERQE